MTNSNRQRYIEAGTQPPPGSAQLTEWIQNKNDEIDIDNLATMRAGKLIVKYTTELESHHADPAVDTVLYERLVATEERLADKPL